MKISEVNENNFDVLRLIAAIMVIVSHEFGFYGMQDPLMELTGFVNLGTYCVYVFFAISGFLITKSWVRNPNLRSFFKNRVLRIFPGLVVVILISMFVVGPIFTSLDIKGYFSNVQTYAYLWNISLIKLSYFLPGVFIHEGKEQIINPPIWTLVFEFSMYFLTAFFGYLKFFISRFGIVLIMLLTSATVVTSCFDVSADVYFLLFNVKSFINFFSFFFGGALVYIFQDSLNLKWYYLLIFFLLWILSIETQFFFAFTFLLLTYGVFYLAFAVPKFGVKLTVLGDFSYGIYIYGYIAQHIVHSIFTNIANVYFGIFLSLIVVSPFAAFSWYFVEKNALKWKNKNSI